MGRESRIRFIAELKRKFNRLRKLADSQSLYEIGDGDVRLYLRYSKIHKGKRTFYGLRTDDLQKLEGHRSFLCLLWDEQSEPLLVPFSEYEDVFRSTPSAPDGQYKTQVYLQEDGTELYIANAGRFNVESHFGWCELESAVRASKQTDLPALTHSQVQTLLGGIGAKKGYDVWVPPSDRSHLDWSLVDSFDCQRTLPSAFNSVAGILEEIDVVWIRRGASDIGALFEVEHTTPMYSGLLRFNDIHLAVPGLRPKFSIVSSEDRRALFARQLSRPTFRRSGLSDMCTFMEYINVYGWYQRIAEFACRSDI